MESESKEGKKEDSESKEERKGNRCATGRWTNEEIAKYDQGKFI